MNLEFLVCTAKKCASSEVSKWHQTLNLGAQNMIHIFNFYRLRTNTKKIKLKIYLVRNVDEDKTFVFLFLLCV